jgi:hypothetical protein
MKKMPRTATAVTLLFLVPAACRDARQPLGPDNQAPTARASGGGTVVDEDGDGRARVVLDASGSVDPDGTIVGYAWTDRGTPLATGVAAEVMLGVGEHIVALAVTDDDGATGRVATVVIVRPRPNALPTVTILSPIGGEIVVDGDPYVFSGTAEDPEDGTLTGTSLVWYVDGDRVGTGSTLEGTWDLADGETHHVGLVATDSDSGRNRAVVTVREENEADALSFATDVLPFFTYYAECTSCHGALVAEGGIRLDSYEAITTGGNANGPLIVPGDASQGILIPQLRAQHHDYYMEEPFVRILATWIEMGAPDS